jgi:hypothetical protein
VISPDPPQVEHTWHMAPVPEHVVHGRGSETEGSDEDDEEEEEEFPAVDEDIVVVGYVEWEVSLMP